MQSQCTASSPDMSTHHRPRLSPKSPGELNARPDYFVTATTPPHAPRPASASTATPSSSTGAQQKQHTFSSPSSHAFNADFDSLMRPPPSSSSGPGQQHPPPQTPLHAPASSPFCPSAGTSTSIRGETAKGAPPTTTNNDALVMQQQQQPPSNPLPPQSASTFKMPTVPFTRRTSGAATGGAVPIKSNRYSLFSPQRLAESILSSSSSSGSDILILDIRTRTAFSSERLAGSINVCVPSTLLRRPAFGVDRVRDSLPPQDQDRFDSWRSPEQQCRAIVVFDQESVALVEGAGPASLLAKFDNAGYQGELGWVKGGWNAVRNGLAAMAPSLQDQERLLEHGEREEFVFDDDGDDDAQHADNDGGPPPQPRVARSLSSSSGFPSNTTPHSPGLTGLPGSKKHARGGVVPSSPSSSSHDSEASRPSRRPSVSSMHASSSSHSGGGGGSGSASASGGGRPVLQVRDLPMSAFQLSSTTAYRNAPTTGSTSQSGTRDVEMAGPMTASRASAPGGGGFSLRQPPGGGAGAGMGGKRLKKAGFNAAPPSLASSHASAFSTPRGGGSGGFNTGFGFGSSHAQTAGANANGNGNEPSVGWMSSSSAPPGRAGGAGGGGQTRASANPFFDNIRQNTEVSPTLLELCRLRRLGHNGQ